VVGFAVVLVGMLVVGGWSSDSSLAWPLWLLVGFAAGIIVGSDRSMRIVVLATIAFYGLAGLLPATVIRAKPEHWLALMLVGATIVASGYALGTRFSGRTTGAPEAGGRQLVGAIALGLVGLAGWTAYSGYAGSQEMVQPTSKWPHCGTPALLGWRYEAINYDMADDADLAAKNPGMHDCGSQGTLAGSEVVTSDGISIAGWHIPAVEAIGPTGPTLIVAPGWKSNKSEILKYAPPLHDRFNLVLMDLRNGGRSGATLTTMGYREALDVRAMIDWLERTKHPSWIGAVGNSMGAATVLNEAVGDQRVRALILDSMHGSITTSAGDLLQAEQHLPGYPTAWAMVAATSLRIGADLTSIDPARTITLLGDRPVLLLHGTADMIDRPDASAERTYAAATAAGVAVTLHWCEGATHGMVIDKCPGDWKTWANDFLEPMTDG
jgi:dienelactone hydrolase